VHRLATIPLLLSSLAAMASGQEEPIAWGIAGGYGYFDFRNSLYADRIPDPPADLGDSWGELFVEPWITAERDFGNVTLFGRASFAYAETGSGAPDLSGGEANSADFDDAYAGLRYGDSKSGQWEIAGGRYPFELANGFLISDGYADGGSRGGLWSNARKAFAPGGHASFRNDRHRFDLFYLERDDRPESGADTRLRGVNYAWSSPGERMVLGAALLEFDTGSFRPRLDGARVANVRGYFQLSEALGIDAEYARERNGNALDASAWYVHATWSLPPAARDWNIEYRYAFFEGDDPATPADEKYDPLFPGFQDWGTWFQGEIAGGWFISNSNLRSHMLRVTWQARADVRIGASFFDFTLDQPGSFEGGVASRALARELDLILDWSPLDFLNLTVVLARGNPGAAVEEAFDRRNNFRYGMFYLGLAFE
jgi:hypothetical protein